MAELYILNQAIRTLKNECNNHEQCEDCPLWDDRDCLLFESPYQWQYLRQNIDIINTGTHYGCNSNGEHEKCDKCPLECKKRNTMLFHNQKRGRRMVKLLLEFEKSEELGAVLNVVDENDCCLNMFTGDEATKLYSKLAAVKEDTKEEIRDCNTCANSTEPDEVDNGCYMCCKGYENNYIPDLKKMQKEIDKLKRECEYINKRLGY